MSSGFCPYTGTQPRHVPGRQHTAGREHSATTLPPTSTRRQHRACVAHPSVLYFPAARCVCRSLRSVLHHLPTFAAAVCNNSSGRKREHRLDYIVRRQRSFYLPMFDIFHTPDIYCTTADTTQITQTTVATPPTSPSSGQKHNARAGYCCGLLLFRRLRPVIRHHHLPLSCCAVHVRPVCRRPLKHESTFFRNTVKWSRCPILGLKARVRYRQRSVFFSSFFFNHYSCCSCYEVPGRFLYLIRNPGTTDNKQHTISAGLLLQTSACSAIHTCRPPAEQDRKQHQTCAIVRPRCMFLYYFLLLLIRSCVFYRTLRSVEPGVCAAVRYVHVATGATILLLLLLLLLCDFRRQRSAVENSRPFLLFSISISFNIIPLLLLYCCVPCFTRVCAVCAVCHAWSAFKPFILSPVVGFVRERRSSPWAPQRRCTGKYDIVFGGIIKKIYESDSVKSNSSTLFPCIFCPPKSRCSSKKVYCCTCLYSSSMQMLQNVVRPYACSMVFNSFLRHSPMHVSEGNLVPGTIVPCICIRLDSASTTCLSATSSPLCR